MMKRETQNRVSVNVLKDGGEGIDTWHDEEACGTRPTFLKYLNSKKTSF